MIIPTNWEYKNPSLYHKIDNTRPQAFGNYGSLIGAFQINCKPVTEHISNLIKTRKETVQSSDSDNLKFSEVKSETDNIEMYMFSCPVDDHYFFATYVITDRKKSLNKKYEADELAGLPPRTF